MAAPEYINNGGGTSAVGDTEPAKLSELLDRGWKFFEDVDTTNESTSSNAVQVKVRRGVALLEEASRMAAQLQLFSRNEDLEEIATADLKFLLVPALLGALTLKQTGRDKRLELVHKAREYFYDFLKRCKDYDISKFELPKPRDSNPPESPDEPENGLSIKPNPSTGPNLVAMASQRAAKIERFRQKKEAEAKLKEVKEAVESGEADEEVVREFYLLSIRRWITVALEEMESMDQEEEILARMEFLKQGTVEPPLQPPRPPMKPFILTKDPRQAQVFGAGYPSLPTMTVDDWYDQHRRQGVLPDQGVARRAALEDVDAEERAQEEKERRDERDDEEALQKARDWDDWKDTHRRGYGNRQNMG